MHRKKLQKNSQNRTINQYMTYDISHDMNSEMRTVFRHGMNKEFSSKFRVNDRIQICIFRR